MGVVDVILIATPANALTAAFAQKPGDKKMPSVVYFSEIVTRGESSGSPKRLLIRIVSAVTLVLGVSFGNLALAEEPTFAKLQSMCRDRQDELKRGFCIGFLEAIALRVVKENKHCALLRRYIDSPNSNLAFSDLISDLDPMEYSGSALKSVEKFFLNRGCN
jgi:hypothetical protein